MDKGTLGLENKENLPPAHDLEHEVDEVRTRLDHSLAELDRRRHELTDVRLQLRRHPAIPITAGVLLLLAIGGIGFAIWRSRQQQRPVARAHRLRLALGRVVEKPEKVARPEPAVPEKILAAVGSAVASSLAKKLVERGINAVPARQV